MNRTALLVFIFLTGLLHGSELELRDGQFLSQKISWTPIAGVAAVGDAYMAVGEYGDIYHSPDLQQWRYQGNFEAARFESDNRYVRGLFSDGTGVFAIGYGLFQYTTDGETWLNFGSDIHWNVRSMAYNGTTWLVSGSLEGTTGMFTSNDGETWTRVPNLTIHPYSLMVANGRFWGVFGGGIYYSTDGLSWSSVEVTEEGGLFDLAWDGSHFVACSSQSVYVSPSGDADWSERMAEQRLDFYSVGAHPKGGLMVASEAGFWVSMDGENWLLSGGSTFHPHFTMVQDQFLAFDNIGDIYQTDNPSSWPVHVDQEHWSRSNWVSAGDTILSTGFGHLIESTDGRDWRSVPTPGPVEGPFGGFAPQVLPWNNTLLLTGKEAFFLRDAEGEWHTSPFPDGVDGILDLVRSGGEYVGLVYGNRHVVTSPDGMTWTTHLFNWSNQPFSIAHGEPGYVVTDGEWLFFSSDAREWTWVPFVDSFRDLTWTGDRFMAVGEDGLIASSPDGLNWSVVFRLKGRSYHTLTTYGNRVYVLGNDPGVFPIRTKGTGAVSLDMGETWDTDLLVGHLRRTDDIFVDERGLILDLSEYMVVYDDQETWKMLNHSGHFQKVVWDGSQYIGIEEGLAAVSADGLNWGEHRFIPQAWWADMVYAEGLAVAVGEYGIWNSADGLNWTYVLQTNDCLSAVIHTGDVFIAVGENQVIYQSQTGDSWEEVNRSETGSLTDLVWTGERLVALGEDGDFVLTSPDGVVWESVTTGADFQTGEEMVNIGDTILVMAPAYTSRLLVSEDGGLQWRRHEIEPSINSMGTHGDVFLASSGDLIYTSRDGLNWQYMPKTTAMTIRGFESAGEKLFLTSEYRTQVTTPVFTNDAWWQNVAGWPEEQSVLSLLSDDCFPEVSLDSLLP